MRRYWLFSGFLALVATILLSPQSFATGTLSSPHYRGADMRLALNAVTKKPDRGKKVVALALHTHQIGAVNVAGAQYRNVRFL